MSIIYLCGFMGCGKSTVGSMLSSALNRKFIDLDKYIEEKNNMLIPEIFEKHGECYFRDKEYEAICDISSDDLVVATGGGALTYERNVHEAKKKGSVVFIDTPFEICYKRIKNDKGRPIADNSRYEELLSLFKRREPIYKKCSDYVVAGDNDVNSIVDNIIKILK